MSTSAIDAMAVAMARKAFAEGDPVAMGDRERFMKLAEVAFDALRAAGFRVVELPKPDHVAQRPSEMDAAWSAWLDGDPLGGDAKWPGPDRVAVDGDEIELGGNNLLPDEADALGLTLLAAASMARANESLS